MAKLKGWTESETVRNLVEQALARTLGEQFGVALQQTIQGTITKELHKDTNRSATFALRAFHAAEQNRILTIHILRFLLGEAIDELPLILEESDKQAWASLKPYDKDAKRGGDHAQWQS